LGAGKIKDALEYLWAGGVPFYDSPESAVATAKVMAAYSKWRTRPKRVVKMFSVNRRKVESVIEKSLKQSQYEIGEMRSKEILEAYGIAIPKGSVATSAEQAVNIATQIGYPVVLKVWSPGIIHKAKVGGVKMNLVGDTAVRDAFDLMMYRIPQKLPEATISGIIVEQMCIGSQEVILGMHRDRRFGPLMMFGMGGKLAEVLQDVAFYPAPLTAEEAKEMLVRTQTYRTLAGDGQDSVNLDLIAEALQRLSQLATEFPQIKEIDINPLIVGHETTAPLAVDAMITLEDI
jgi:acetyltransferase